MARAIGAAAALLACALWLALALHTRQTAAMGQRPPAEPPLAPVTVPHGPFQIVPQGRMVDSGTFPNQGARGLMEVTGFSVYHQGQPVVAWHEGMSCWVQRNVATVHDAARGLTQNDGGLHWLPAAKRLFARQRRLMGGSGDGFHSIPRSTRHHDGLRIPPAPVPFVAGLRRA